MKVKKIAVPVYNVQLSNLEATSALHALRTAAATLTSKRVQSLTPYQKAALAFCKGFESSLVDLGVQSRLGELEEKYRGPVPEVEKEPQEEEDPEGSIEDLIE